MTDIYATLKDWRAQGRIKAKRLDDGRILIRVLDAGRATSTLEQVHTVFDHWREEWKHPGAVLDDKRTRLIRAALTKYDVAKLCKAISGYKKSPHHCGQNPTSTVYDDIGLFLRDVAHIEAGIRFGEQRGPTIVRSREDPQAALKEDPETNHQKWLRQMREYHKDENWQPAPATSSDLAAGIESILRRTK